jgi:hypothetical protein
MKRIFLNIKKVLSYLLDLTPIHLCIGVFILVAVMLKLKYAKCMQMGGGESFVKLKKIFIVNRCYIHLESFIIVITIISHISF